MERSARRRPLEHTIATALRTGHGRGVLITGGAGQLGHALAELYPEALAVDLAEWDISLPAPPLVAERDWELVVHGAAWTNVDGAEDDPQGAAAINVGGTQHVAELGAPVVAFSTDYVFDGTKREPYVESDAPNPQGVYGRTKLHGEAAAGEQAWVVRSSWLFGASGHNFVRTMLRVGAERDEVSVVDDQRGCPTYVGHLAAAVPAIAELPFGVYHVAASGDCTWADFAEAIFEEAGVDCRVRRVSSDEYPMKAARPAYSVLRSSRARRSCRTGATGCASASRACSVSSLPAMRVLVTGGAGFIGSHFVRRLLAAGDEVVVLDKITYAAHDGVNLEGVDCELHRGDIVMRDDVDAAASGCEAIVNFAAETHVDRSILGATDFGRAEFFGTQVLLEHVREHGERFVQVSTDEVYGDLAVGGSSKETDPVKPSSPYSVAKAAGDLHIPAYARTFGVNASITRGSNTYGPNQYPEKLIPLFVTNALEGKKLPLYGDGKQIRDWLYVEDHCAGIELVLREGAPGEAYNVGGGDERENVEVVAALLELVGADESLVEHVADRAGHDRRYSVDSSKLKALGWAPQVPFAEGLRTTVDWYRERRDWWEPIKSGEFREYYERQYAARLAG